MWLSLVGLGGLATVPSAHADPLNVWPERTPRGTLGFNPYVGVGPAFAQAYVFAGASNHLDLIAGYTAGIEAGEPSAGPLDGYVRAFPFDTAEIALVLHAQYTDPENWFVNPELHAMNRPTDWFGLWLSAGWQGTDPASDSGYLWVGTEITGDVPFLAFEADFDFAPDGSTSVTLIPSAGVWLGWDQGVGVSAGVLIDPAIGPTGGSAWVWWTVDLTKRAPLPPYEIGHGCLE